MLEYFFLARSLSSSATAAADAASAKASAQSAAHSVTRLEQRLAAAELMVETLARALVQSGAMSEEQLFRLAREVDMEDGILDGRRDLNKLRKFCPACQRASPPERPRCIWCGHNVMEIRPVRLTE